jgi:hypothetical protein
MRGRLEVETHRSLAAIDGEESTGDAALRGWERAQIVTDARILDLDHVGAHVGEHHREERPREEPRQIEYADAG